MRTSLNNLKAIEDYLLGKMAPGDALVFQANMLLNADLIEDMQHQQEAYSLIRKYSRQSIKAEIIAVQETLTAEPQHQGFMQRIFHLFK